MHGDGVRSGFATMLWVEWTENFTAIDSDAVTDDLIGIIQADPGFQQMLIDAACIGREIRVAIAVEEKATTVILQQFANKGAAFLCTHYGGDGVVWILEA